MRVLAERKQRAAFLLQRREGGERRSKLEVQKLPEQGFRGISGYEQAAGAIGGGDVSIVCFRDIFEGDL